MTERLLVACLITIIGLVLILISNISVFVESYVHRSSVVNTYQPGLPLKKSVSAYFEADERFFFNFSPGRFWSGAEEVFEPAYVSKNLSVEPYKAVTFIIHTPSNDTCEFQAWVIRGLYPFVILFLNKSEDFTPLPDGNLTFGNVGVEGIVKKSGVYNFTVIDISPPAIKELKEPPLSIDEDPPRGMHLYVIRDAETKPYYPLFPIGVSIVIFGALISLRGTAAKRRKRLFKDRYRRRRKRR